MDESERVLGVRRFYDDGGLGLLNAGITPESVVVEFGGYLGDWVASILPCTVLVFEPVFHKELAERFQDEPSVTVHPFALGEDDGMRLFGEAGDATGIYEPGSVPVRFRSVSSFMEDWSLTHPSYFPKVDVMSINIEGGEYDLIPALLDVIPSVPRILVQFHLLGPDPEGQREHCRSILLKTHHMTWCYDFVWECWEW